MKKQKEKIKRQEKNIKKQGNKDRNKYYMEDGLTNVEELTVKSFFPRHNLKYTINKKNDVDKSKTDSFDEVGIVEFINKKKE